jgi:hypothetical protein
MGILLNSVLWRAAVGALRCLNVRESLSLAVLDWGDALRLSL